MLTEPPVKKIDLHFPLGLEVTARNMKGVTIKDALDAIYKQFRKKVSRSPFSSLSPRPHRFCHPDFVLCMPDVVISIQADDELENPVLAGFEWDKEESWTRLIVHCKKEGAPQPKKKSKKADKEGHEGGDDL
jgi:hypothetical protein